MNKLPLLLMILMLFFTISNCDKNDDNTDPVVDNTLYFPSVDSDSWETKLPDELNWDDSKIDALYDYLSDHGTRAFIVLVDGKIAIEKYWGKEFLGNQPFDMDSRWYWASASKTVIALLFGIAQEKGLLDIDQPTSTYLGNHWSSIDLEKENLITLKHHLTMTTGLDYTVPNPDCMDPDCFLYKKDAGTQWFYHNGAYTLLNDVILAATGKSTDEFMDDHLESISGMKGTWVQLGDNKMYFGTARDAARFGLVLLNEGTWKDQTILADKDYFTQMTNSSQEINPSYGYLTWLNGKSSIVYPGSEFSFNVPLSLNAPADMYAGLGANGQFINVIPNRNMVVIRLGDAPDSSLVPVVFHDTLWEKISDIIN